jgi:thiol-disulfide isomerase/thioredoxin
MTGVWVLLAAVLAALVLGLVLRRRSGSVRAVEPADGDEQLAVLLAQAGVPDAGSAPLLLHFSASWCGPCVGVRQLVGQLAGQLPWLRHVEVDVSVHPELSARLRVLSLPSVLIYDTGLQQRFRVAGAPSAADLRAALAPLSPGGAAPGPVAG